MTAWNPTTDDIRHAPDPPWKRHGDDPEDMPDCPECSREMEAVSGFDDPVCRECDGICEACDSEMEWRNGERVCQYCKALNPGWGSDALVVQNSLAFQWAKLGRESRKAAQVIKAEIRKSRVGRCLLWVARNCKEISK